MLLNITIKLETPVLGDKRDPKSGIRRLNIKNGQLQLDKKVLSERFRAAVGELGLVKNANSFEFPLSIRAPSIHMYKRTYDKVKVEFFECIRKGTVISFRAIIRDGDDLALSLEETKQSLEHMGMFYGMSEWGMKFNYGRFQLTNIE